MANLDQIYEKIKGVDEKVDGIDEKVDLLREWRAGLDVRCEERGKDISNLTAVVFGNPTPESGLVNKVQRLTNCKKQVRSWKEFWTGIMAGIIKVVVAAAIIGIAAWLLSVYKGT